MNELKLADLGEGMHEAEIVEWLIKEGDSVKLDQPVVRVETDKAIVEIPSPVAGRVSEVRFQPGQTAKVGEVLVVYDTLQAPNGGSRTAAVNGAATLAPSAATPARVAPATNSAAAKKRVPAAPAVRKLAFELGVELAEVTPSAANGRVTLEDVRIHAERAKATPADSALTPAYDPEPQPAQRPLLPTHQTDRPLISTEDRREPLTWLRKRIAEHMKRPSRTIPHATAFDELDASELVALRRTLLPAAERRGAHLTYMPLLIKLLVPVLREFPIFNASLDEEKREIIFKRSYHIGLAADSPEGLLVPVLRNADHLTLLEIASKLEKLIEGARKRTLALNELSGSTFTLNNVGSFGGSSGTPIINYPEVAILAVGRIEGKSGCRNRTNSAQPRFPLTTPLCPLPLVCA